MTIKISKNLSAELKTSYLNTNRMLSRILDDEHDEQEITWYDLATGMVLCSESLLECNGGVIECL